MDMTITLTPQEAQYLANAIDTHIKTHGLGVATVGVMIVSKLQAASNGIAKPPEEKPASTDRERKAAV